MTRRSRTLRVLASAAGVLLATGILLCLVEGAASVAHCLVVMKAQPARAERLHTEYDPLLGWINRPNVRIRDMYGPGKNLSTNARRFRSRHELADKPAPGKERWICAGDSFTLGFGVDDDATWVALIPSLLPTVETVNMGQGGYGIDQAFLWYTRDGLPLEHTVLVFAFIVWDFQRLVQSRTVGCDKPWFELDHGVITVANVPVPEPSLMARYLPRLQQNLGELRTVALLRRWLPVQANLVPSERPVPRAQNVDQLIAAVFNKLYETARPAGRTVVLVYLPTAIEYDPGEPDSFRALLQAFAAANGWHFIDLVPELRQFTRTAAAELFLQADVPGFLWSRGHYTEKGNRFVAEQLAARIPAIRANDAAGAGSPAAPRDGTPPAVRQ